MPDTGRRQTLLEALWSFFVGVVGATALVILTGTSAPAPLLLALGVGGLLALAAGLILTRPWRVLLLLIAGMLLGGRQGLVESRHLDALESISKRPSPAALRVSMTILEGWSDSRWGRTTTTRVDDASLADAKVVLPRRCRLEVRGAITDLPPPGTRVRALVALKGSAERPLLVAASRSLLKSLSPARGAPALRDFLAHSVITAAGTNPDRIRAAELAAALALGRRDLIPAHRRQGWRSSGLAHALAVSGLHVGIISATLWLLGVVIGLRPTTIRWILLSIVPIYTILAGSAPSAVRACLMVCLYLAARLLGRAAMPLGTILTAASVMLLISPGLILNAGFQLTVTVTAALIRWAPSLVLWLRGPRWFRGILAVPIVAQLGAAPIVAFHFRTATPLAAVVNLAVPLLLTPTIPLAVLAVILSPLHITGVGLVLDIIRFLTDALWFIGGLGRHWTVIVLSIPGIVLLVLAVSGLAALRYDRPGRIGATLWITLMVLSPLAWGMTTHLGRNNDQVELLPVGDGLALTLRSGGRSLLFDGGRFRSEAAEMLADTGTRRLTTAIVSHGDEDHSGGIVRILQSFSVDRLILPAWLFADAEIVPILRAARHSGTTISTVARGSVLRSGSSRLDILWPPTKVPHLSNNDRSLVIRARVPSRVILLTADIGSGVERTLAQMSNLHADILLTPHHGSASSTSTPFIEAVSPSLVLIPAGPRNRHHHPSPVVLERLEAHAIPFIYPARDGRCGARASGDGQWQTYTMAR